MSHSSTTGSNNTSTTKLGARFTQAESRLLDLVSTATGVSVSAYIRSAVKQSLLEDFLKHTGHQSTIRSASDMNAADAALDDLLCGTTNNPVVDSGI